MCPRVYVNMVAYFWHLTLYLYNTYLQTQHFNQFTKLKMPTLVNFSFAEFFLNTLSSLRKKYNTFQNSNFKKFCLITYTIANVRPRTSNELLLFILLPSQTDHNQTTIPNNS